MKYLKAITAIVASIALVAAVVSYSFMEEIGEMAFHYQAKKLVNRNSIDSLPDGLHVALVGSGSPLADTSRMGPCTAIIAGKKLFIVDAGSGAPRNLLPMGLPTGLVEAVFMTHYHSDHIDGLGQLIGDHWIFGGKSTPLPIYGPTGVDTVVNAYNTVYQFNKNYRTTHHGAESLPPEGAVGEPHTFTLDPKTKSAVVYEKDGLKVTAFAVNHEPVEPAVGYRFDYKGRSIVVSGDCAKSENLIKNAKGTDLLVHEALNKEMLDYISGLLSSGAYDNETFSAKANKKTAKNLKEIQDYHTSPVDAAKIANLAGVKELVLTHLVPSLPLSFLNSYFLKGTAAEYKGPITVGEDGMVFSLPAGNSEIISGRLK